MNREAMLQRLEQRDGPWDMLVIGGGATGLGCAVDAASRGYAVALLERGDFAKGTSSRSTKLVHGGVRYLKQGNFSLVLEALAERGLLRQNAPHLVHDLPFVVPNYEWWEAPFYGIGMKLYDVMAGKHGFGKSRLLSKQATIDRLPTIETDGLLGGVIYHDGQFDDARLALNLAQTAIEQGAAVVNYVDVTALTKNNGVVSGVEAVDVESGKRMNIAAKVVVNATGPFVDGVRRMDEPDAVKMVRPSQGVHVVLPRSFLPGDSAIMVPRTSDKRVIFVIPWHGCVVAGTTDTPLEDVPIEPTPMAQEVDFILELAAQYLSKDPTPADVLSVYAGVRPLVGDPDANTAALSREHTITISRSGLLTVAGGKWTTYRKMAEDVVDHAAPLAELEHRPCATKELPIHGHHKGGNKLDKLNYYGCDADAIRQLVAEDRKLDEPLDPALPYTAAMVVWACREEMARTVEDVLSRRTRALLLNARASIAAAPKVAAIMAKELHHDKKWRDEQVKQYGELAQHYLLK